MSRKTIKSPTVIAMDTHKVKSSPPRRSVPEKMSDWFVWEILGMIVSAGALIALVTILVKYDQKPQPSWRHMSLNALISWMSTISKGCIIIASSEALGQLKWVWFSQKARPISELRTFDSASRSLYGAVELIWTLRARHFAALSSLAVILALAIDPFAQNLVRYYPGLVDDPSQRALTGQALTYLTHGPDVATSVVLVDPILKSNVYNSLFNNDPQRPWSIPQYSCATANCTWAPVVSLEARALCANITDRLTYSCRVIGEGESLAGETNCTVSLPNSTIEAGYIPSGPVLTWMKGFVVKGVTQRSQALVYKNFSTSAVQIITPRLSGRAWVAISPSNETSWEATECTIEPIIRSFRASVINNTYTDETLAIWTNSTVSSDPQGFAFNPPWGHELGMEPNQTFTLGLTASAAIGFFLDTIFGGSFWRSGLHQSYQADFNNLYAASDILQALGQGDISGCSYELAGRLNCTMHNVAQAVSKAFRDSQYSSDPVNDTGVAVGRVRSNVTYISVSWQWIALPIFAWVVAAAGLIGTLWKIRQRRVPRWKNNPLPLLFLYRDSTHDKEGGGMPTQGTPNKEDSLEVRLYDNGCHTVLG
ncbi:hypothetical protein BDW59DRAFT_140297 [Aspergillus cavernicola]|uniref:Uncharacterized protein n=1 Tax=Aspergillus cavernicola TaxID=176166 RepID=A0ABR4IV56_9EURO